MDKELLLEVLHRVSMLPHSFNWELNWDTEGIPDGEACDEFGTELSDLSDKVSVLIEQIKKESH